MKIIDKAEQEKLFSMYETPEHVQLHCNEVARVAGLIGEALNEKGYHLDIQRIRGAAMVHDLVRVQKDHDIKGGEILDKIGYHPEAELVRHHMKYYPFSSISNINEQDVLCLADRLVKEHQYVGLDARMDYLIHKPGCTPEMEKRILKSKEHTAAIIRGIESVIGESLDDLCAKNR